MSTVRQTDPAAEARSNRLLGQRLALFRAAAGLRLADVAAAAGVGLQLIQRYETGETAVPFGRLVRLSEALGVPLSELIGEAFDGDAAPTADAAAVLQIARLAGRLPPAKRTALAAMARELGRP